MAVVKLPLNSTQLFLKMKEEILKAIEANYFLNAFTRFSLPVSFLIIFRTKSNVLEKYMNHENVRNNKHGMYIIF